MKERTEDKLTPSKRIDGHTAGNRKEFEAEFESASRSEFLRCPLRPHGSRRTFRRPSPAPQQRGPRTDALIVGAPGHLDRRAIAFLFGCNSATHEMRVNHPERASHLAAARYGVVVRAQHQATRARNLALYRPSDISDGLEMRAQFRHRAASARSGSAAALCSF